ncbi:hypothetical protein [Streptomyces sp. NPDC002533]
MTTWLAGMRITADRLAEGLTPVTTVSGLVAATGWAVLDFRGARRGAFDYVLDMYLNRTGTQIVATSGNIPDTAICTVPDGWRPNQGTINGHWDDGTASGGFIIGTNGVCTLRTATGSIDNNRNLRLHIEFTNNA